MYLENGVDVELHRGGQAVLGVALHSVHQVLSCVYTLVRRRAPRPQKGGSMEKRPGDVERGLTARTTMRTCIKDTKSQVQTMRRAQSRFSSGTLTRVEGRRGLDDPGTIDGQQPIHT